MYVLLGLAGFGFILSLGIIIHKASKGQPKKKYVITLAVCLVLGVVALILKSWTGPAVPASTDSGTTAPTAAPAPAAIEAPSSTKVPATAPATTSTPVPTSTSSSTAASTSAPTEAPTAEPASTLTPVSDEQLDEGYLDAWFDDSVMVGDSIAGGLNMYVTKERANNHLCLGNMRIVGVSGLTLQKALSGETKEYPAEVLFRSRFMTISEVVEITQSKRLFLMMGVRDLEWYSPDRLVDIYGKIIALVKADHPDLKIYVHSIMPTLKSFAMDIENMDYPTQKETNEKLRAFCEANGYTYIELADLVRDEDGFLKYEYSGPDYSFHPNDLAKAIWVKQLRCCARDEYYAGIWKPEENAND